MTTLQVVEANLGHADGPRAVRERLTETLPRHGRWVVLACEAHQLWGTPYAPAGGTVHQAEFTPPPAPQNWHNRSRGKAEVAVITGPDVHVTRKPEWVKVMDGPPRPSKFKHDRWLLLVWATVDGERFLFISGHFQANVARGGMIINPRSADARDYRGGVEKTCQIIVEGRRKGYRPVFGCDLNHRRISIPPWDGNPHKRLKAAGMAVRSHKIDALATDATTIRWASDVDVLHPADGCDHDWLRGRPHTDKEADVPRNSPVRQRGVDPDGRPLFASDYLWEWWEALVFELGFRPTIVQGSWMSKVTGGGAEESAGYHNFGGALDIRTWDLTREQIDAVVWKARLAGGDAWERRPDLPGGFDEHIHIGLHTDTPTHSGIQVQHADYLAGGNGLSGSSHGPDHEPRPDPLVTTPPKEAFMPTAKEIAEATREVVKEEVADAVAALPDRVWAHKIGSIKPEDRDVKAERMLAEVHRRTGDTRDNTTPPKEPTP